ncbi:MAG: hypothetical protein VXW27_09895, partial [Pseudomonadota bacterium]|nr:hypothetical protein [Pseudomonadota bacterium]
MTDEVIRLPDAPVSRLPTPDYRRRQRPGHKSGHLIGMGACGQTNSTQETKCEIRDRRIAPGNIFGQPNAAGYRSAMHLFFELGQNISQP